MAKEVISGAEALMRSLQAEGVTTIFGYPGGSIMPVFDALYGYTRGENKVFDHILVRHEQAAAHAAQGYARVSAAPISPRALWARAGECAATA